LKTISIFSRRILSRKSSPPPSLTTDHPFDSRACDMKSTVSLESYSSSTSSGAPFTFRAASLRSYDNPIRVYDSVCNQFGINKQVFRGCVYRHSCFNWFLRLTPVYSSRINVIFICTRYSDILPFSSSRTS
jgi:hypothetical protein